MTQLTIEQSGQIVETVSESLVKKLYDTALEIPKPEGGEEDNAYMSGHISVPYTYKQYVEYLAGSIGEGTSGVVTSLRQNVGGRFSNLRIDVTNGYYIPFEDPNVVACLNSIGVGSNGHVTTTDAQSVNSISDNLFKNNTSITSFNEFKYFTSITSLNASAFQGCSNLSSIEFPSSLQELGQNAFKNDTSLSGIIDLSNTKLTWARTGLFQNTKITGIIFPTTLTAYGESISSRTLSGVTTCTIFKGLDNVTSVWNADIINCTNAVYLGKYTTGRQSPITGGETRSASVNQIYFPVFTNYTENNFEDYYGTPGYTFFTYRCQTFRNFSANLVYFKDLQTIIGLFFYGTIIKNLVINNTTPPVFDTTTVTYPSNISSNYINQVFGQLNSTGADGMIIYVPDSAVSTYQANANYNSYVIRGINEINPSTNQPYLTRYATNELWEAAGSPADALIEEYM